MIKPRIHVSKCITFEHCRWNGLVIASETVDLLKPFVEFLPACPEVEIGLGVPRKPIRLVKQQDGVHLLQQETEADVTEKMAGYARDHLAELKDIDGFVLKSRSPSCGMKDVKLYPSLGKVAQLKEKAVGLFAEEVYKRFGNLPIEDEGRLTNFSIREHFLTRVFATARFRAFMRNPSMGALVQFHAENKLLLMAYHQSVLRELGKIVANHERLPEREVFDRYEEGFRRAFVKQPRYTSNINVLMHALGYFSDGLLKQEKAFFLDELERYRLGKIPLSVPISIVKSFIVRFGEDYLRQQTYFDPYPEALMALKDSGEGRKLKS